MSCRRGERRSRRRRVGDDAAEKVWEFVRKQVKAGRQAYVVYPVIEEGWHGTALAGTGRGAKGRDQDARPVAQA